MKIANNLYPTLSKIMSQLSLLLSATIFDFNFSNSLIIAMKRTYFSNILVHIRKIITLIYIFDLELQETFQQPFNLKSLILILELFSHCVAF